jgi:hypothetical protein
MNLIQEYAGREHTPSGTTFHTDVHGKVGLAVSIDEIKAEVESKPLKVLGSAYPVAWGAPDGDLPKLKLMVACSGVADFEKQLRDYFDLTDPAIQIELAQLPMTCTLVSEAVDGNEDALPTRTTEFTAFYCGHGKAVDRGNNDPIMVPLYLQQTSPAREI